MVGTWVLMVFMVSNGGSYAQNIPTGFSQEFTSQANCEKAQARYASIHVGEYKPVFAFCTPK